MTTGNIWRRSLTLGTSPPAPRELNAERPVRAEDPPRDLGRERLDAKLREGLGADYDLLREILEEGKS